MNKQTKIAMIFGTRPEAIKMLPLAKELNKYPEYFKTYIISTGQHKEMLQQVFDIFNMRPDFEIQLMKENQTLNHITTSVIMSLQDILKEIDIDIVLVHGDTTTTFAGALASFYNKTKIGHIEAGLRTNDKYNPYPEEMNRKLTSVLTDYHFAPTNRNFYNLVQEGVNTNNIHITGNTVIDAFETTLDNNHVFENKMLDVINYNMKYNVKYKNKKIILVTAHRRENLGEPLENICNAIKRLAGEFKDIYFVYPVHLNPKVKNTVNNILGNIENVLCIEPVNVKDMHNIINASYMVLTDSGGLQEEAPSLGKPVLVMRNETERQEAIYAGTARLIGTDEENIYEKTKEMIENEELYKKMANAVNPYGDGKASQRIVKTLMHIFKHEVCDNVKSLEWDYNKYI